MILFISFLNGLRPDTTLLKGRDSDQTHVTQIQEAIISSVSLRTALTQLVEHCASQSIMLAFCLVLKQAEM